MISGLGDVRASGRCRPRAPTDGRRTGRRLCVAAVAAVGIAAPTFASAQANSDATTFYRGKTIQMIVGYAPGGGYDTYARVLAKHISSHIPGHPTVIVQNMPGSGSLQAVRYLNMGAATNGTVVAAFSPGLIAQSIMTPAKIGVNFKNYGWLGSISEDIRVCYTWHTRNAKRWQDLLSQKPLSFGATSPGTLGYIEARILKEYLHIPLRLIPGYPGSAQKRLAVEGGELDGDCGGWVNIPQDWLANKQINVMVRFSKTLLPGLSASTPYVGDLLKDPLHQKAFALLMAPEAIGRPFIVSNSVPAARLTVLRAAFAATMTDPGFVADVNREKLTLTPMTGQQVETQLSGLYDSSPNVVAEARRISERE